MLCNTNTARAQQDVPDGCPSVRLSLCVYKVGLSGTIVKETRWFVNILVLKKMIYLVVYFRGNLIGNKYLELWKFMKTSSRLSLICIKLFEKDGYRTTHTPCVAGYFIFLEAYMYILNTQILNIYLKLRVLLANILKIICFLV